MTLTPEQLAREKIDARLAAAGWIMQDNANFNRNAGEGVAVRNFSLPNGPCDYLLFVGGKAAGVIEAKKSGTRADLRRSNTMIDDLENEGVRASFVGHPHTPYSPWPYSFRHNERAAKLRPKASGNRLGITVMRS